MADSTISALPNATTSLSSNDRLAVDPNAAAPTSNISGQQIIDGVFANAGLTPGGVLFAGTSGEIDHDSLNFVYNTSSDTLSLGTNLPSSSAIFEISSTSRGFLPPRMTTTERDLIASPATALEIYNLTTNQQEHYDGTSWVQSGGMGFNAIAPIDFNVGTTDLSLNINSTNLQVSGTDLNTIQNISTTSTPSFNNVSLGFADIDNHEIAVFNGSGQFKTSDNLRFNTNNYQFRAGNNITQSGNFNAAFGQGNTISNQGGAVFGQSNSCTAENAVAIGQLNTVSGGTSFAMGENCDVTAILSFAGGERAQSTANNTFTWSSNLGGATDFTNSDIDTASWRVSGFRITTDNTATHDSNAILELGGGDKYLLSPNMTTAVRDALTGENAGALIYNSTSNELNYYDGSSWISVSSGGGREPSTVDLDGTDVDCLDTYVIEQGATLQANVCYDFYGGSAGQANAILFTKAGGTFAAPTVAPAGSNIGAISWAAYDGSTYALAGQMIFDSIGTASGGNVEGEFRLSILDSSGTSQDILRADSSVLEVNGSLVLNRTATATDAFTGIPNIIGVTDTSVARTITLSTQSLTDGRPYIIKDESGGAGTNNITINTEGAENIDGSSSIDITVNYGVLRVYSDGTNWFTW